MYSKQASIRWLRYGRSRQIRRAWSTSRTLSTAPTEAEVAGATTYCQNLLRSYDTPSLILQSFVPPHVRPAFLSIHALNITLAMLPDTTSTPTVGAMRAQFWQDTIDKTFAGKPPKEPIAILLSHVLSTLSQSESSRAPLSKSWVKRLISTRESRLNNPPFPDIASLESYAENTYSTLLYLILSAYPVRSVTVDHLASHIGKATGIATILRGLPVIAFPPPPNHHSNQGQLGGSTSQGGQQQGRVMLPLSIMAAHNLVEEDVLRHGSSASGLRDAVFEVATRANDHLITAREMLKNIQAQQTVDHAFEHEGEEGHQYDRPSETPLEDVHRSFGAFLPAITTQLWLHRLEKSDFDIFNPSLRGREWKLPWKAYMAFRRRKL